MTPLRLDLTDEPRLRDVRAHRPLDEALAASSSPPTSSPEQAERVRQDEAATSMTKH
jgi:hypothetical protein